MKITAFLMALMTATVALADIVVYTDRPQARFAEAIRLFAQEAGEKVTFVEAGYGDLLKKIETDTMPADLVITKDVVYLAELKAKNLLSPMVQTPAVRTVHPFMRNDHWVGLTFRVRSVVYDPARVSPSELTSYADLADSKWAGRLCLRTGKAAYNQALVGHLMMVYGDEMAKDIVSGWVANLAAPVFGDDTAVINSVADGICDVGIVNHYYLAGEIAKNPNLPVRMAFLDQQGAGVHTNGTGVGIIAGSRNKASAQKFIDILLSPKVQLEVSAAHYDYPAVGYLAPNTFISGWGPFLMSQKDWNEVGSRAAAARKLMTEVGYN